ncbi:MAG: bifunctional lysine ketoglutarate reductase /saccharopine dehydrogenase family protein [Phycisphaerae bacterium]
MKIGIRREDKSRFEARVPLIPEHVAELIETHHLGVAVQPSPIRAFPNQAYERAGATVTEDLGDCDLVLGVKEIPLDVFVPGQAYLFFSHTIKGQAYNMPMLAKLMELGCTLMDYEKIADQAGRRLIFFGRYAGLAGMIDALWTLGRRLDHQGIESPFARTKQALHYTDLDHAKQDLAALAQAIQRDGLPDAVQPLVCGFAGYGNVSQGAQEVFDLLKPETIAPDALLNLEAGARGCYKVVFHEEHLVRRVDGSAPFELSEYYDHPDRYQGCFGPYLKHLTLLVNCIYWEPKYPRLVTRADIKGLWAGGQPRLKVIADISCDVEGSIECTVRATDPGDPVYVYNPTDGSAAAGVAGDGPVILAVDTLPCELPVDSSRCFSDSLRQWMPQLATVDWNRELSQTGLPDEFARATLVHRGRLTGPFEYLAKYLP